MFRCIDRISKVLDSSPGGSDSAPYQPSRDKCTSTKESLSKEDEDLNAISLPQVYQLYNKNMYFNFFVRF